MFNSFSADSLETKSSLSSCCPLVMASCTVCACCKLSSIGQKLATGEKISFPPFQFRIKHGPERARGALSFAGTWIQHSLSRSRGGFHPRKEGTRPKKPSIARFGPRVAGKWCRCDFRCAPYETDRCERTL